MSEQMMGAVCYVDLYAKDFAGIRAKIPYFKQLGITYLHLMPLFRCPPDFNDGGYAVSSFRETNPALGSMADLSALAADFRANGISLCLDFVFNHTSDQHEWALKAKAGDPDFQDYYLMFDDRTLPDRYEQNLREIFPEQAPGNFTYFPEVKKWVWTTFNTFQWDLNYRNPDVFRQMLDEMLFLANQGCEVLRLDAVVFIWKELGTTCENLPPAHEIIAAYNALVKIVAPAMIFKSEAIVHPDWVAQFLGRECEISYNPTFMVLLWEALATRNVTLLRHSMVKRFKLPANTAWVNYTRSHDDIGWSFADEDAAELGINGYDHRQFLNRFYTGRFEGSFASGMPFNFNPATGDMRISGTGASLAGLEQAILQQDQKLIELALGRIKLIIGLTIASGGIPLLYLGDEWGQLNDYDFRKDPAKAGDSRWVHRVAFNERSFAQHTDPTTITGKLFDAIHKMIGLRKAMVAFSAHGKTNWLASENPHVLVVERSYQGQTVVITANFTEHPQTLEAAALPPIDPRSPYIDLLTGITYPHAAPLRLQPYEMRWLTVR
jgi:glycosidase